MCLGILPFPDQEIHGKSQKWTFVYFRKKNHGNYENQGNHRNGFQGGAVDMTETWDGDVDMT
jgi:hypothetical protein